MFVVFDLDDTLADSSERVKKYLYHPGGYADPAQRIENPDWESFFAECVNDRPITEMICLLNDLIMAGHYVEIWTARCESVRSETIKWLCKHDVLLAIAVRMRPIGDRTDDTELKRSWLYERTNRPMTGTPDLVFEDRTRMVEMYRSEGIRTLQVAPGNF